MSKFDFQVPTNTGNSKQFTINCGELIFILGANGTGKSALLQRIFNQHTEKVIWIFAHRTVWLQKNSAAMDATEVVQRTSNIKYESASAGRIIDSFSNDRRSLALVMLIQAQNFLSREIAAAFRAKNTAALAELEKTESPLKIINDIFLASGMDISISINEKEEYLASKAGCAPFSITNLSDGEKNAFLLCAEILTAKPGTLILLDEGERHLHHAIISPLMTALVRHRSDCAFIISTHDLNLPADHPHSTVILLRSVTFTANQNSGITWVIDSITGSEKIPEDIKKELLGSRKRILFVEGVSSSLDRELYQMLLPDISVQSKNSCGQIERTVEGIRLNPELTWVEAYGLIDADDRTSQQIARLEAKGVYALPAYSVEYLYYNLDSLLMMANHFAAFSGANPSDIFQNATASIVDNFRQSRDRLCARLCERKIAEMISRVTPDHNAILAGGVTNISLDHHAELAKEQTYFDALIASNNIDGLLTRYPFRETKVIDGIIKAFGIRQDLYEQAIRKMVLDGDKIKALLLGKLGKIATVLAPSKPVSSALPVAAAATPTMT